MAAWALGTLAMLVVVGVGYALSQRMAYARRERFIRDFRFPPGLYAKLQARRPALGRKECELVAKGLRQFFLCYLASGRRFVSMPSQVADDLWHEFILYTRHYDAFCQRAFGRMLHHTPAVVLQGGAAQSNAGLRRTWAQACREENIDPRRPTRLPLLFALDGKLGIDDGFRYVPDCQGVRRAAGDAGGTTIHCGGDFSDSGIDGGTEGFGGDADGGGGGDGGGCGGGCGGD